MLRRIVGYLRPHRRFVALAFVCMVVQALLALAPALVIKSLVDYLTHPHGSFGHVGLLIGLGVGAMLVGSLIAVAQTYLTLNIGKGVVAKLRQDLADHLLGQSVGFFTGTRGGDLMSRILNDVGGVDAIMSATLLGLLRDAVAVVATGALMFVLDWRLALCTMLVFPVMGFALRLASRPIYRTRLSVQLQLSALTAHLQEALSLSGIMLIKSFAREADERARIAEYNDDLREKQIRAGMAGQWVQVGLTLLQLAGPAALLAVGGYLVVHDEITLGTLMAFLTVVSLRFAISLQSFGTGLLAVVGALPMFERIFEVLDEPSEIRERPDARPLEDVAGAITLDGVTFGYPRQKRPALDGVSVDIAPGQLIALVGPSGAGKTTLSSLVPRFYDPQHGRVLIDGQDVRDVTLASLSRAIGIVSQDTYLFHGTIAENLLYARPQATQEQMAAAARDAHLDAVIAGLPDGFDTLVGERGHRLSGGEKQRLAIARVILKDAPILILDEATSHLDSISEQFVQSALARLFENRTSLVIAHRLSTVLAADLIVVLEGGRAVERGTHGELVRAGGLYSRLYDVQFRSGLDEIPADAL